MRRSIVHALLLALGLTGTPAAVAADSVVGMLPNGAIVHRAEVPFSQAVMSYAIQSGSQWCWAASLQMVFNLHGHPVSQARIVQETFGAVVNAPAHGITIAQQANRPWVDDNGEPFQATLTYAFDAEYGVSAISNGVIVALLQQDQPLIVGTVHHAMVLTAIDYADTPMGPYVLAVYVFDPWPGRGPRMLAPVEFTPVQVGGQLSFIAAVSVD